MAQGTIQACVPRKAPTAQMRQKARQTAHGTCLTSPRQRQLAASASVAL